MRSPVVLAASVVALAVVDVGLLAWAVVARDVEIRDGAGSVTTGGNVALAILVTLVATAALERLVRAPALRRHSQVFLLAAMATHALGHLAGWYYDARWYDDALHAVLPAFASVLLVRHAQATDLFPSRHATPLRAAILAFLCAAAVAAIWESFEFVSDLVQSTREQDDLVDTMRDILAGLLGGVAAAAWLWRRPRGGRTRSASGPRPPRA